MRILEQIQVGPYELKNRMVMAPMTRSRAGQGNAPTQLNTLYYQQRSTAGLIISEAAQVSAQGVGYIGTPGIYTDDQIRGWMLITKAVHNAGSRIFCQLFHGGRISHVDLQENGTQPVAPSEIQAQSKTFTMDGLVPVSKPRALRTDEIPNVVEQFRHAAQCALQAGFDGVEIHAANGYLPDQFLRDSTNKRTDQYGGSIENRARFLLEVTEAVVGVWAGERVGIHISPVNGFNDVSDSDHEALFGYVTEQLNRFGLAYLHVLEIDSIEDKVVPSLIQSCRKLRKVFNRPYMANGLFDKERAERNLISGEIDLVSFGRPYIANPDLPRRFSENAPLAVPDHATFYGGAEEGYTDYPFMF
jgi:N-ethylmaleimide reductase